MVTPFLCFLSESFKFLSLVHAELESEFERIYVLCGFVCAAASANLCRAQVKHLSLEIQTQSTLPETPALGHLVGL